jgi:hypothetical protein
VGLKIQGPIDVELKIHITDGRQHGVATIAMGRGRYPSDTELRERVQKFVDDEMPDGFRLLNKREMWEEILPPVRDYDEDDGDDEDGEPRMMRWAMPGHPTDFDA